MSLGSILVRLAMNTADFETDAGRAAKIADKRAKEIDAAFKKAGTAIGAYLSVGKVKEVFGRVIDRMDEVSKSAQKIGLPTEEFSRLAYAGDLADVSMESMVSSLGKLTKSQAAALDKTSEQAKMFDALGISVKNADGSMRKGSEVLLDFADRFQEMDGSPEAMAAGFALFGRSFQELIPLLKDGSQGIREAMQESDELGNTLSGEAGRAAEEFNDNITRLQTSIGGLVNGVAADMLPALIGVSEEFIESTKQGGELRIVFDGIVGIKDSVVSTFTSISEAVGAIAPQAANSKEMVSDLVKLIGGVAAIPEGLAAYTQGISAQIRGDAKQYEDASRRYATANAKLLGAWDGRQVADFSNVQSGSGYWGNVVSKSDTVSARKSRANRVAAVLGESPNKKAGGKAALNDEQKAAQELQREYDRLLAQMKERVSLFGAETEAAKLAYDFSAGSLQKLSKQQKKTLMDQAETIDKLKAWKTASDDLWSSMQKAAQEDEESRKRVKDTIVDLNEQNKLLRMNSEQQQIFNALKYAGVEAASDEGKAIEQLVKQNQQLADMRMLAEGAGDAFGSMFTDIASGTKTASEAFKDFIGDMSDMIIRFLAQKAVEKFVSWIMGSVFGGGNGTSGWWSDGKTSGFGFAGGGYTGSGSKYQPAGIVHAGEFVINAEATRKIGLAALNRLNRGYANGGYVAPATHGMPAINGGMQVVINNNAGAKVSTRTEQGKGANGDEIRKLVIDIVADSMAGGQLGSVTKNRFGLREPV